jgi:hypothetical protein
MVNERRLAGVAECENGTCSTCKKIVARPTFQLFFSVSFVFSIHTCRATTFMTIMALTSTPLDLYLKNLTLCLTGTLLPRMRGMTLASNSKSLNPPAHAKSSIEVKAANQFLWRKFNRQPLTFPHVRLNIVHKCFGISTQDHLH